MNEHTFSASPTLAVEILLAEDNLWNESHPNASEGERLAKKKLMELKIEEWTNYSQSYVELSRKLRIVESRNAILMLLFALLLLFVVACCFVWLLNLASMQNR